MKPTRTLAGAILCAAMLGGCAPVSPRVNTRPDYESVPAEPTPSEPIYGGVGGKRVMFSPALVVLGSVFAAGGATGATAAFVGAATTESSHRLYDLGPGAYNVLGFIVLAVGAGISIPLIVLGAEQVPSSRSAADGPPPSMRVGVGPDQADVTWSF